MIPTWQDRPRGGADPGVPCPATDHLESVIATYVTHYNTARRHRGINLRVPAADVEPEPASLVEIRRVDRLDVLGGLVHEYRHAA